MTTILTLVPKLAGVQANADLSRLSAESRSLNSVDTQYLRDIDLFPRYAIGTVPQVNSRKNSLKAEDVPDPCRGRRRAHTRRSP